MTGKTLYVCLEISFNMHILVKYFHLFLLFESHIHVQILVIIFNLFPITFLLFKKIKLDYFLLFLLLILRNAYKVHDYDLLFWTKLCLYHVHVHVIL